MHERYRYALVEIDGSTTILASDLVAGVAKKAGAEKANEGDGDEEFVGKWIKETAEVGLDLPFAGEVAIEPIGQGGGDKEGESEPRSPSWNGWASTGLEKDEQDEGGDDSGYG